VKEQSQIDEMRAALRGDRERAEVRRRSTENVLALTEPTAPADEDEPKLEQPRRRSLLHRLLGR
jgi:hypothetical protein